MDLHKEASKVRARLKEKKLNDHLKSLLYNLDQRDSQKGKITHKVAKI